jgi:hypothetical protein
MKYTIVQNLTASHLIEDVNTLLKLGWKLQGGLAVVVRGTNDGFNKQQTHYCQAMTKETEPE